MEKLLQAGLIPRSLKTLHSPLEYKPIRRQSFREKTSQYQKAQGHLKHSPHTGLTQAVSLKPGLESEPRTAAPNRKHTSSIGSSHATPGLCSLPLCNPVLMGAICPKQTPAHTIKAHFPVTAEWKVTSPHLHRIKALSIH